MAGFGDEFMSEVEKEQFNFAKGLNDEIKEVSERYTFWIEMSADGNKDNHIIMYDYSLEERIFDFSWTFAKLYARIFIDGFMLGRNTVG